MNKRICLSAVLLVLPLTATVAQEAPPPLEPGTRVRVTAPDIDKYDGTLQAMRGDTLTVDTLRIAVASVTRLDVYRGQKSKTGKGALIGAGVGFVAGALTGLALCGERGTPCESDGSDYTAAAAVILGGGGALLGAGIGAVVGSQIKGDRWEEVPLDRLQVSFVPQRDGFTLGFSVAF